MKMGLVVGAKNQWSPNRDTVIPCGITVKTGLGTKPHFLFLRKCVFWSENYPNGPELHELPEIEF